MTKPVFDVVVIGGGLHGLSAGMHLARAGMRVVVLERAWVGRHASGSTAAGVRTLNRDFGELDLSLEAMDMWHDMAALVGDDCGFHPDGQICIAEKPEQLLKLEKRVSKLSAMGHRHETIIDWKELSRLVPAIGPRCAGASIATADGAADPHRTISAFRRSALAAGVVIREGCSVQRIERHGNDWAVEVEGLEVKEFVAPFVVNAAGAWGGRVAAMVGDVIPLGTKASMMIASERLAPMIRPVVSLVGRSLSFKQSDQGTLIIGGGLQGVANLDTESSAVRLGILSKGARAATDLFPCVRDVRMVRVWAGLEANTSDGLPVIGPAVNAPGVIHAFGYSGHGFELVPVVGATITDLIKTGSTRRAIGALAPQRLMSPPIQGVQ
jgi:sarcosine oxidase subunit beta